MGNSKTIRLGSFMKFDEEKEQDLIKIAEALNSSHRMGEFMGMVFRVAVENPEVLVKDGDTIIYGKLLAKMKEVGISEDRFKYFRQLGKVVANMEVRVNNTYKMSVDTYELAKFGNRVALEDKSRNQLMANFVIERQLKQLTEQLGIKLEDFESDKLDKLEDRLDDMLQLVIDSYGNLAGAQVSDNNNNEEVNRVNKLYLECLSRAEKAEAKVKELEEQRETDTSNEDNISSMFDMEKARIEREELEEKNRQLEEELRELRLVKRQPSEDVEELKNKIERYKRKVSNLEEEVEELEEDNSRLRKKVKRLTSEEVDSVENSSKAEMSEEDIEDANTPVEFGANGGLEALMRLVGGEA